MGWYVYILGEIKVIDGVCFLIKRVGKVFLMFVLGSTIPFICS